jgi:drug/metabolite transporter (DMT)-like permease
MKNGPTLRPQRWLGLLFIVVSAASFGTLGIFARLAYADGAGALTVLALRFALAGVVMLALMLTQRLPFPRGWTLLGLTLMGALGYVSQSFSYFTALTLASVGLVALLLYLYPAIVTLLALVFLRERLTSLKLVALLVALAGTALTIGPAALNTEGSPLGIALAVAAALIYSVYILVGARVTPGAGAIPSSTVIILSSAAVFGALVAWHGPTFPASTAGWEAVAAIALISTVLPIVSFFAGLARVGPTAAATLSTFEPVVTVTLAALLLGEPLMLTQMAGGALILLAAIALAVAGRDRRRERTPKRQGSSQITADSR